VAVLIAARIAPRSRRCRVSALVPQYYTSYTFTTNHTAGSTYSFYVYAVDAASGRELWREFCAIRVRITRAFPVHFL
jgi:outer membrane protein assembly factor BamB